MCNNNYSLFVVLRRPTLMHDTTQYDYTLVNVCAKEKTERKTENQHSGYVATADIVTLRVIPRRLRLNMVHRQEASSYLWCIWNFGQRAPPDPLPNSNVIVH